MRNTRLAAIAILLLAGIAAIMLLPMALKALPTRYAMRLPEPLQALALPGDPTPVLPTASAPRYSAAALLLSLESTAEADTTVASGEESDALSVPAATATPPPSPTPQPVAGLFVSTVINESTPIGTAVATPEPLPTVVVLPVTARLEGITHKFQEWNNCGPATLAMALSYFQLAVSQTDTAAILKPNPEDRNVSPAEMAAYVNDHTDLNAIARANGNPAILKQLISAGIPVIIELGIEPPGEFRWLGWYGHYLLPVAYDEIQEQFWVYDSWFGTSEEPLKNANPDGRVLTYEQLAMDWPQFNRNYIVLYRDDQQSQVAEILGDELDDAVMWRRNLTDAQAQAVAQPDDAFVWFNLGTAYSASWAV